MLDIDHFKKVNDRYGHIEADRVLRDLASAAVQLAERVRKHIARVSVDNPPVPVTASFGVSWKTKDKLTFDNCNRRRILTSTRPKTGAGTGWSGRVKELRAFFRVTLW